MSRTTIETVQEFYGSVHAGDFDRLFNTLAEDCQVEFQGPSIIPFAGVFTGKEKCKIFFGHVANDVEIQEFSQAEFICQGDKAAVTGRLTMVLKATGRLYSSEYAHVITVRDGRVVRFRDFQDTAQATHVAMNLTTPVR